MKNAKHSPHAQMNSQVERIRSSMQLLQNGINTMQNIEEICTDYFLLLVKQQSLDSPNTKLINEKAHRGTIKFKQEEKSEIEKDDKVDDGS